jgi:hypothetical protein
MSTRKTEEKRVQGSIRVSVCMCACVSMDACVPGLKLHAGYHHGPGGETCCKVQRPCSRRKPVQARDFDISKLSVHASHGRPAQVEHFYVRGWQPVESRRTAKILKCMYKHECFMHRVFNVGRTCKSTRLPEAGALPHTRPLRNSLGRLPSLGCQV